MNANLQKQFLRQQANNAYKKSLDNLTQQEVIIKCHEKSAEFITEAQVFLKNKNKVDFTKSLNKSLTILENIMFSLNFHDNQGNKMDIAYDLYKSYDFIVNTIRSGMRGFDDTNFNSCVKQLNQLANAYSSI